jgi:hypothetical protein
MLVYEARLVALLTDYRRGSARRALGARVVAAMDAKRWHRRMARPARASARRLALEALARNLIGSAAIALVYTKALGLW